MGWLTGDNNNNKSEEIKKRFDAKKAQLGSERKLINVPALTAEQQALAKERLRVAAETEKQYAIKTEANIKANLAAAIVKNKQEMEAYAARQAKERKKTEALDKDAGPLNFDGKPELAFSSYPERRNHQVRTAEENQKISDATNAKVNGFKRDDNARSRFIGKKADRELKLKNMDSKDQALERKNKYLEAQQKYDQITQIPAQRVKFWDVRAMQAAKVKTQEEASQVAQAKAPKV